MCHVNPSAKEKSNWVVAECHLLMKGLGKTHGFGCPLPHVK